MHNELFRRPTIVARYCEGPYAEARESFLKQARAKGYAPLTLERMARALLLAAHATHLNGGQISSEHLKTTLANCMRRQSGSLPSVRTVKWFLHCGEPGLFAIGALLPAAQQPTRFDRELRTFAEDMAAERGLSPVTVAGRRHMVRRFFASLPPRVQAIEEITLSEIECFLRTEAKRGWSRRSLHTLGSTLRSFFRFAACQGWCQSPRFRHRPAAPLRSRRCSASAGGR